MKQLPPLFMRSIYWKPVEDEINLIFREIIFAPIMAVLKSPNPEYTNASDPLAEAIQDGLVWYENGHFYGEFNAAISRELRNIGALYHTKSRTWSLEFSLVPPELRAAQAHADGRYDALRKGFMTTLADMDISSIELNPKTAEAYKKAISWMDFDFQKSVKAITIAPTMTDEQRDRLAEDWGKNLNLYIKKWAEEEIYSLREKVQNEAFEGRRAESMEKMIIDNYGVSERKAKFLARQETSLLMSKFHESRYKEIGVKRYKWSGANDARERPDHKDLNGKIFSFDDPPITDKRTGTRNNPGEDFGCRCVAIAMID